MYFLLSFDKSLQFTFEIEYELYPNLRKGNQGI